MNYPYKLPELKYSHDALEPSIDAKTMEIHHTKHHQTYIDKLNTALEKHIELQSIQLADLLCDLNAIPEEIRMAVRNNGGGHLNHTFFWDILTPNQSSATPTGKLSDMINESFGNFETFKEHFTNAALNRFGSGWAWLVVNKENKLEVTSTANQDNPVSEGKKPIIGIDVWEHAYYLKYQNKRVEYVQNFWKVIDWNKAEQNINA